MEIILNVTQRQCPHESQEKGLYEGKSRTSKTHTGEKQLIFFSFFFFLPHSSYFLLILLVPMVVLCFHEHLTHGSSLGCGRVISEPDALSLGSWLLTVLYLFCLFPHKLSAGLLTQTHRRATLCVFIFFNNDEKKKRPRVSLLDRCVPDIVK